MSDFFIRMGDKWSLLTLALLRERSYRFNELNRAVDGISQRVLTLTLRGLERDGFITRTVHPTVPPSVEYALTELGLDFMDQVNTLAMWALGRHADLTAARTRYDHPGRP
ncbi:winged helix-turn-helix transcriptional regulator [Nonomuraea sediminis]|uniref:winged helix-turn-helix transcriptional regulator n=1 Tax=Nonomuraea sediminis TaxID=2835864 RepID=UPI0027E031E8|nr:helix-turn-helix domain-containing protein [Nonomuraea sediminis]